MSGTESSVAEPTVEVRTLADCIEHVDTPIDSRSCPHDCHGNLDLTDSGNVICQTCRCTPDGVYLPPKERTWGKDRHDRLFEPRGSGFLGGNPWGQRGEDGSVERAVRYDNSNIVQMAGGYEEVYNRDPDIRPNGVGTEYTFDLSTL